jgi:hypothetical protein
MRRPVSNGSSSATLEVLVAMTFVGASAWTVWALVARRRGEGVRHDAETPTPDEDEHDDR